MIKILTKARKRKFSLIIITLFIAIGLVFYLFLNLFSIFDVSNYRNFDDFTIDYSQGFGGINVDFRMSYRNEASFGSRLIFQTISSEEIEEIGITKVSYDVYKDELLAFDNELVFSVPVTEGYDIFIITAVALNNNISCIGAIDAEFDVEGIIQYETINFVLNIIMPINPYEIRQSHLINLIWIEFGLGASIAVFIGIILRTIQIWRRESTYTEEEKEKDREYFDYIGDKLEEYKKKSS
ncbi:MAG: hypothetical protein ACFFCY_16620 [Promethearchaeota archaeon]